MISNQLIKKVKQYVSRLSWRNCLTFFFFILLAIIFWCIQVSAERIEISKKLILVYTNINDSIIFEEELPTTIDVKVKDQGSSLLKYYKLGHDYDTLRINMDNFYSREAKDRVLQGSELDNLLRTRLLSSSDITSVAPSQINLNYHKAEVKKVPVIFDGTVNIPIGFQLEGDITMSPDSVFLIGKKSQLDSIHFVYTHKDTISNIQNEKFVKETLIPISGVKMNPTSIILDIPVKEFIEKKVSVPIECLNLPEDLSIQFFPSQINVTFLVSIDRGNSIDARDFRVVVNYLDILEGKSSTVHITLLSRPDYVRVKEVSPNEVEYILEEIKDTIPHEE